MPNVPRVFKETQDQIIIQQGRGLQILNDATTQRIIEAENYYKLFNGYKEPFLDSTKPDETYLPGTKFEEVYALYLFDRELRNIFIRYILEIENNVKSVLAHEFSRKYGYDNYLKVANFDTSIKPGERKTKAQKVGEISDLISNLQHEVARQLSKNNSMVSHYMLNYGYIPLWVLVNTLTIGTISVFYSHLGQQDQNNIGRFFSLKPDELKTILQVLTLYRNACAHDERLYNLKSMNRNMRPNNIKALPIHATLGIPKNTGNNYMAGVNDLFAIVLIFKTMLSKDAFAAFYDSLDALMQKLSTKLTTISISRIEADMGFVPNWRDVK
jgi:abortive infection bacteriophage resistance protein